MFWPSNYEYQENLVGKIQTMTTMSRPQEKVTMRLSKKERKSQKRKGCLSLILLLQKWMVMMTSSRDFNGQIYESTTVEVLLYYP